MPPTAPSQSVPYVASPPRTVRSRRRLSAPVTLLTGALLALSTGLVGCDSEANYTLQLRPSVPLNQTPFAGNPNVWVRITDADGQSSWTDLGTLDQATVRGNDFGVLDQATVGVALAGPDDPEFAPDTITAYGAVGPVSAADGGEELDLGVLVSDTSGTGALTRLDQAAYGAAIAALDDGRVYAFGGINITGGSCSTDIRVLPSLGNGEWAFRDVDTALPQGVCGAVATVIDLDGREQILLTGGQTSYNGNQTRSNKAVLFDPLTEEIAGVTDGTYSRARHAVAPLPDGRLLLVGAHQINSVGPRSATWEILDPAELEFGAFDTVDIAPWDFMWAPVDGGVVLCGGGQWVNTQVTPLSACTLLNGDGSEDALPSMPWRLRAGAMTRLLDGRLVVAGGITEDSNAADADGVDAAFILDLDADTPEWEQLPSMNERRAYPVIAADAAGGAVVIGGADAAWAFGGNPDGAVECGERLVFAADGTASWQPLTSCAEGGKGVLLSTTVHPRHGLLTLEGRDSDGDGGSAFGVVSLGPLPDR